MSRLARYGKRQEASDLTVIVQGEADALRAGGVVIASADLDAVRNELAARDVLLAEAVTCADALMRRLHEAHAECAAAEAALVHLQCAVPQDLTQDAAIHATASGEDRIEDEIVLAQLTAALHLAQAETADRDAALIRARTESAEQRFAAAAARDEIATLRRQLEAKPGLADAQHEAAQGRTFAAARDALLPLARSSPAAGKEWSVQTAVLGWTPRRCTQRVVPCRNRDYLFPLSLRSPIAKNSDLK